MLCWISSVVQGVFHIYDVSGVGYTAKTVCIKILPWTMVLSNTEFTYHSVLIRPHNRTLFHSGESFMSLTPNSLPQEAVVSCQYHQTLSHKKQIHVSNTKLAPTGDSRFMSVSPNSLPQQAVFSCQHHHSLPQ
jgi:hypothetical protein